MAGNATHITLPDGLRAFVFGSVLRTDCDANDLDVLFVYDTDLIPPQHVYQVVAKIRAALSSIQPLPIHPLVLSDSEETAEEFLFHRETLSLAEWLALR